MPYTTYDTLYRHVRRKHNSNALVQPDQVEIFTPIPDFALEIEIETSSPTPPQPTTPAADATTPHPPTVVDDPILFDTPTSPHPSSNASDIMFRVSPRSPPISLLQCPSPDDDNYIVISDESETSTPSHDSPRDDEIIRQSEAPGPSTAQGTLLFKNVFSFCIYFKENS